MADDAAQPASPTPRTGQRERAVVLVNAKAGSGRDAPWAASLAAKFADAGVDADVRLVHDGAGLAEHARRAIAAQPRLVIAAGGDGTINTIARLVADSRATLGVLPMGTLNHFAKDLGVPVELDAAVVAIANGRDIEVDFGEVADRVFLNNSSIGIYPHFVIEREQAQRRLGWPKWPAAIAAAIASLRRFPYVDVELDLGNERIRRTTPCVFVGNNEYSLAGMSLGERERLDAGYLTVHVVRRIGRLGLLRLALRALFGRLERDHDFDRFRVREFEVRSRHARLRVATDGEVCVLDLPLRYRVRPRALRVRVPAG